MSHKGWIESVVAETVKTNGLHGEYSVKIHGDVAKSDHFASDMTFVEVFQKNHREKPIFNLILKYIPLNPEFKEKLTFVTKLFRTEIDVYTKIIPRYQKLQKERSLSLLDFVPKCYYTRETDSDEVLALENIKPYGFQLHPKEVKMDQAHIRLVLNRLAQWHALSFSLKDRYFEEFKKLHENHKVSVWKTVFDSHVGKIIEYSHKSLYKILEETGQIEILNKFKANCKCLDSKDIIYSLINEDKDEKHAVLIHGDCWNSNFMFQYKDEDHSQPTKIQLLDFQVSSLRSPIIDVSQFIYTTASAEELKNIKAHLTYYYNELSKYIEALGSDPQELFTPKDFQEQWHKYSAHGVLIGLIAPIFIHLNSVSLENETVILELLPKMVAKPEFIKRVTDIAKCFATFEF